MPDGENKAVACLNPQLVLIFIPPMLKEQIHPEEFPAPILNKMTLSIAQSRTLVNSPLSAPTEVMIIDLKSNSGSDQLIALK